MVLGSGWVQRVWAEVVGFEGCWRGELRLANGG